MPLYKRRVYSGSVLEQEVYNVAANVRNIKAAEPKLPAIATEEERRRHREGASRLRFVRLVNANFDPQSFYATFTLDSEHFTDDFKEADRILSNYIRRLRNPFPDVVIVAVMGRGKNTGRIHFHAIIARADEAAIMEKWNAGSVKRIERLREHNFYEGVDHGSDYTGLANYLFDHWTEEQGGKRWKQTRNIRQPVKETPKPTKQHYDASKPPKPPPGYDFVSFRQTPYGYQCFTYVRTPKAPMRC